MKAEASTGGLVAAALIAQPGASQFFLGSFCVYSGPAARGLLPVTVIEESGMADKTNYSNLYKYLASKR